VPVLPVPGGIRLQGIELAAYGYCEKCNAEMREMTDK
jgi:RNA polymerase-binding transcription factor DksA